MPVCQDPIAVFDSGMGGLTILSQLVNELPHESYLYYGDSAHAPYGTKLDAEIVDLMTPVVEGFLEMGAKALVIACNTATAAAAATLRARYPDFPIIGVEPALKPAVLAHPGKHILVMATQATLHLEKFAHLNEEWGHNAQVTTLEGTGIVELIESGRAHTNDMLDRLQAIMGAYKGQVDAVVLGCTHYPFIKDEIAQTLGGSVEFFDAARGTAHELRRQLAARNLLADESLPAGVTPTRIAFDTSLDTDEARELLEKTFLEYHATELCQEDRA